MLLAVRLRGRAAVGPQVEGGEARRAAGDGRVRDLAARRHHRAHLSGGGQHGEDLALLATSLSKL